MGSDGNVTLEDVTRHNRSGSAHARRRIPRTEDQSYTSVDIGLILIAEESSVLLREFLLDCIDHLRHVLLGGGVD
jgi:hypothetical protein